MVKAVRAWVSGSGVGTPGDATTVMSLTPAGAECQACLARSLLGSSWLGWWQRRGYARRCHHFCWARSVLRGSEDQLGSQVVGVPSPDGRLSPEAASEWPLVTRLSLASEVAVRSRCNI